ncbi:MAG: hypothetical protein JW726_14925 [Anaerolineales bacterium]|nr:hypothetical protein [Anaerolineales bacterium]
MNTLAWLAWLVATLVALSATRNPLYLMLTGLCILITAAVLGSGAATHTQAEKPAYIFSPLRFSLFVILLAAIFNLLTSHYGETILFSIPAKIPLLSGPLTLEAFLYGATNGLVLAGFYAAFAVLNRALPVRSLVRLIPRAFYPVAVVTAIAVTYVPITVRQSRQVREAQAIRGHKIRRLSDWLPLLMPLLIGGLEHALALAEAMTARGFASSLPAEQSSQPRLAMLAGLVVLATGWVMRLIGTAPWISIVLMAWGVCLIVAGLWGLGRLAPRTTYRRELWQATDTLVSMGALLVIALFLLPVSALAQHSLAYSPYPLLSLPQFDPWLGVGILALLFPAMVQK